jgi:hypothetical protein
MIVELLHGAQRLDTALSRKLGPSYNVILGIGLMAEAVRHLRAVRDPHMGNAIASALAVALFSFLLLHQLAELAKHFDQRQRRPS